MEARARAGAEGVCLLAVPGTGGTNEEDWDTTYKLLLGKNTTVPGGGLGYDGPSHFHHSPSSPRRRLTPDFARFATQSATSTRLRSCWQTFR